MQQSIGAMIKQLQRMSVGDLRANWEEVFGEPARSNNKDYLWKRIAWRIQADMEGGLSDQARERAREIAREGDIRLRPPRGAFEDDAEAASARKAVARAPGRSRDPRLPAPGTLISREYRGRLIEVLVKDDSFEYEGRPYRSLSAISKAVTGAHWNGYDFFALKNRNGEKAAS